MNKRNNNTICFVAGKSGGHIIPCLTLADNFYIDELPYILFFSSNTDLDKKILGKDRRIFYHIMLPLRAKIGFFKTAWHLLSSFCISLFYLYKYRPKKIITTGGIVAIPTCVAGFILRIPIILYSLDAVPGKAIKLLAPFATLINVCFANSQKYFPARKCKVTPYPIKYKHQQSSTHQETALHNWGLSSDKKTIVLLGGSQGSLFLNNCIKQLINDFLDNNKAKIQIIHQTGSLDATDWKDFYKKNNVTAHVFNYISNLEQVYRAADLIICRAGAGTLFEVKFFNKPCIIIPLETNTTTHQVDNALAMNNEYPELFSVIMQRDIEKDFSVLLNKIYPFFF